MRARNLAIALKNMMSMVTAPAVYELATTFCLRRWHSPHEKLAKRNKFRAHARKKRRIPYSGAGLFRRGDGQVIIVLYLAPFEGGALLK